MQLEETTPQAPMSARSSAGLCYLSMTWQDHAGHFACRVSAARNFAVHAPVHAERFTAFQIGLLLDPAPRAESAPASVLASKIAQRFADDLAAGEVVSFFHDASKLPADADCTALAYLLALRAGLDLEMQAHRALDRIVANVDQHGVVATYFDPSGERSGIVDAVVAANVVRLATRLGRLDDVRPTTAFLENILHTRSHLRGTRYYPSPDCLLHSLALGPPMPGLRDAIAERIGVGDSTIDLAQRVMAARRVGIDNDIDRDRLLQKADATGTWGPEGWFCYGRSRRWFGSRALSTAFALAALATP